MSDTAASLRRKISGAGDLQSVVRTMKAMAASSIGQYENAVRALDTYYRTVQLGLVAGFRQCEPLGVTPRAAPKETGAIGAVVFGSDQGLVGQFNEVMAEFVVNTLDHLPGQKTVWVVGERLQSRLADTDLRLKAPFVLPNAIRAITPLVGQILIEVETQREKGEIAPVYLFYNRPPPGRSTRPSASDSCRWTPPGAAAWRQPLADETAPRGPAGDHDPPGLHSRVRVRLDLPRVRRIAGEREREPPGGDATGRQEHRRVAGEAERTFHRLRQSSIDEELFDVISGYEALSTAQTDGRKDRDENQRQRFSCAGRQNGQPRQVADAGETGLQVEEEVPETPRRTGGGTERAATPALCVQPLCRAADFSGDGRRRQGRRHPARDVRRQSAGLSGVQLQTSECRGTGA